MRNTGRTRQTIFMHLVDALVMALSLLCARWPFGTMQRHQVLEPLFERSPGSGRGDRQISSIPGLKCVMYKP